MKSDEFVSLDFLGYPNYRVNKNGLVQNISTGKTLKQFSNHRGYKFNVLYDNKINRKQFATHRLVALAFIPNPENKPQVNHIDGNKENNCVENLEWCTNIENNHHAYRNGLHNSHLKISKSDVKKACKMLENGKSISETAKELGTSRSIIAHIKRGDAWKWVSENYDMPKLREILNPQQVHEICNLLQKGLTPKEVSSKLNISCNKISAIRRESTWKHIRSQYKLAKASDNFLREDIIRKICSSLEKGERISNISRALNVPIWHILNIKQKKAWTNISKEYNIPDKDNEYLNKERRAHDICKCMENGMTNVSIASRYNISLRNIERIRSGKRWHEISKLYNIHKDFNSPNDLPIETVHQICKLLSTCKHSPDILFKIAFECFVDVCIVKSIYCKTSHTEISQQYPNIWRSNDRVQGIKP